MGSGNGLTVRQEGYVQSLVSGLSQRKAYRANYSCNKMADNRIDEKACTLLARPKVRARYDEVRAEVAKKLTEQGVMTVQEVLDHIQDILVQNKGMDDKTALRALELYGKHLKMFTDKIEHSGEVTIPQIVIKRGK